jgi:hypothetical protein
MSFPVIYFNDGTPSINSATIHVVSVDGTSKIITEPETNHHIDFSSNMYVWS